MDNKNFEIKLINKETEEKEILKAKTACTTDHCSTIDFCSPSGCNDTCGLDFSG